MGHFLSQVNKLDSAIAPASLNGAGTSGYYGMSVHRKALFMATFGAIAAGETAILQVLQALDDAGTDSKVITDATVTVTANNKATVLDLAIVTAVGGVHVAGQTVTIGAIVDGAEEEFVFTAAAADVPETREYAVGTTGADSAANLLAKINSSDENIGVPGVIGTSAIVTTNTVLTLKAEVSGETTISGVASAATTIVSTVEAIAFVEVGASALDVNNDFSHVAIRATNSAAIITCVQLVRDHSRYNPSNYVAGSVVVVS